MSSTPQLVEIIPAQAERDSGIGLKLFGFIAESAFTFIPERCSGSSRKAVRNHPGIAFTLDRNPQSFLQLETRRVTLAGITTHPTEEGTVQMARRAVDDVDGSFADHALRLHDRDTKFCAAFRDTPSSSGVHPLVLPARSPNLNAFAERSVRSVKSECLLKLILFGEGSLRRATTEFIQHYHLERPHQGKGNKLFFPAPTVQSSRFPHRVEPRERPGGLLKFYGRAASIF